MEPLYLAVSLGLGHRRLARQFDHVRRLPSFWVQGQPMRRDAKAPGRADDALGTIVLIADRRYGS